MPGSRLNGYDLSHAQGPVPPGAHLGKAARQGAGRVPSECPEAKRWAPSIWQREKQLAQERSHGLNCWGCVSKPCVQDTVLGCPPDMASWSRVPSHCIVLPPKLVELELICKGHLGPCP